jgi:Holliday junction resolvase
VRRAAKVDGNQVEIVKALRKIGANVLHLHQLGKGVPDLLACLGNRNVLLEVKVPGEKLTKDQVEFIATWGGEMHIVHSPAEAVTAMVGKEAMR